VPHRRETRIRLRAGSVPSLCLFSWVPAFAGMTRLGPPAFRPLQTFGTAVFYGDASLVTSAGLEQLSPGTQPQSPTGEHMRVLFLVSTFAALSVGAPPLKPSGTVVVLPVAPGGPGGGPFRVETWPYGGCKTCSVNPADLSAFQKVLTDLSEGPSTSEAKLPIEVVRTGHGVLQSEGRTSFEELARKTADCTLESTGILESKNDVVAFGVQIACGKNSHASFMSVVMDSNHAPSAIYWLPDGPIYAIRMR
jgi:hypothetical protein